MKKLMRLLALTLAAAMLLSMVALAAENNEDDGPKLVAYWLQWDENNKCYLDEGELKEHDGRDSLEYDPDRGDHVVFFILDNGKKTPVVPTGDGINVILVDKEDIKSGAKQSKYYVYLVLPGFQDATISAEYKGKTLTFPVTAGLPEVGFYSKSEASEANFLTSMEKPVDPSTLTDKTVYFVATGTMESNGRVVTDVKKQDNGNTMYDLEQVSDTVWKITLKTNEDLGWGVSVDLDVTWQDENDSYSEYRGCYFDYLRGPELWVRWLDWNDYGPYLDVNNEWNYGHDIDMCPGEERHVAFFTCDYDDKGEPTFTLVPPEKLGELKTSGGVTLTSLKNDSFNDMRECFFRVTVSDWNKTGTISYGDYTMKVFSRLPDVGLYTKPEATPDNYLVEWTYSPTFVNDTVYVIGQMNDEVYGRHMTDLTLPKDNEDNRNFTLEKISDGVYKLTRTSIDAGGMTPQPEITWSDLWGSTYTETLWLYTGAQGATLVLDEPIVVEDGAPPRVSYDSVKSSDTVTLDAGTAKTVYVATDFYREDLDGWMVVSALSKAYTMWKTSDPALTFKAVDEGNAYTISCDTPGTYTVYPYYTYPDITALYHADGTEYTDAERLKFYEDVMWQLDVDGSFLVITYDEETDEQIKTPFAEAFPGEKVEYNVVEADLGYAPLTVIVTGEAPKLAFTDVKDAAWYLPAVRFANANGYMNGKTATTFDPEGKIKGCEFATILHNKDGKPAAAADAAFAGVDSQWYAAAILWAAGKGIVADAGDAAVDPEANLTRQQIALMLYNYMGKPAGDADLSKFGDADKISDWALDAVKWAVSAGVLKGSESKGVMDLNPTGTATRAETAQILMNFFG